VCRFTLPEHWIVSDSEGNSGGFMPPHSVNFCIGGVAITFTGHPLDIALVPSLLPFSVELASCDIRVRISRAPKLYPSIGQKIFDSGSLWRLQCSEQQLEFDFTTPVLGDAPYKRLRTDSEFRDASLLMSEEFHTSTSPLEYPLDELLIMHRLTQERGIELHGVGMVGPNGANNLFVGHSGAGKSTTARLWTSLHEVKILSDDRIIVRESPARDLPPDDDPRQIFMYGTPWHGEACFASPDRAPLHRIFILEHGQGNVITRLNRSQAVGELFARAFVPFHRHEYIESALSFLEQLAESVPCYRYSFEPDARAVEKILHFHD
jgi:hypothetical protein